MPNTSDPNIPLQAGQNIPTFGFMNPQQRINMQVLAIKLQQAQQNQNAQNMLRSLYGNQENFDPTTNQLKPAALNMLTAAYPQEGMAVRTDMLKNQEEQARASFINSKVNKEYKSDLINEVTIPSLRVYDDALASGKPPPEALQLAQQTHTKNLNDWKVSSGAPPSFTEGLHSDFDPVRARNNSLVFKQQQAAEKEQLANTKTQTDIDKARHDMKLKDFQENRGAYTPATQVTVDDGKGGVKPVLAQQDKDSGGWVTADSKHTPLEGVTGIVPKGQEGMYGPAGNAAAAGLTGEDFLKTLPAAQATVVQKMAKGEIPFPGAFAMRSPYWQQMIQSAAQYDPTFNAATYPTRVAAYKDVTSGKSGQTIGSLNTAVGHLGELNKDVDALGNVSFTPYNTLKNYLSVKKGDPAVTNFNTDLQAVVTELTRAFRGSGGNEADIERWLQTINSSESPAQLRGAIGKAVGLLESRLNASTANYTRAIGPLADVGQFIQPKSRRILEGLPNGQELLQDYGIAPEKKGEATPQGAPIPPKPLEGTPHLLPQYNNLGTIRPLGPGEFFANKNGSWSNEITTTVKDPSLNSGKPSVVPTLWVVDGKPTKVSEDQAAQYAAQSGLTFPSFDTEKQADQFANQRESNWQKIAPSQSGNVPPLWSKGNPNEIKLPAPVKMGNHPTVYPGVTYEMYQKLKPGDIYTVPGNSTPQMKQ